MNEPAVNQNLTFTITLPAVHDINEAGRNLQNVFTVLDNHIPEKYELLLLCPSEINQAAMSNLANSHQAVKIIPLSKDGVEWKDTEGDVLMVVDGDLSKPATALLDVVKNLESGSDMALLTHYTNNKEVADPVLTCFAIRRQSLKNLGRDSQGYQLLAEVFGNENLRKITEKAVVVTDAKNIGGFFSGLRSILNEAK